MFSKFKKVLVSLALASSLALAPMNVSAAKEITQSDRSANTAVYVKGHQLLTKYKVTIPQNVTINLDDASCDDLNLTLTQADDFESGKVLQIKPTFKLSEKNNVITIIVSKSF